MCIYLHPVFTGYYRIQLSLYLTLTLVWHESFWTNFLSHLLVSREQIIKIYIHTVKCHSRVAEQIHWITCKLHARSEQICRANRELHWSTEQICWATHELHTSAWSDALVEVYYLREMYHVFCKIHAWPRHL